MNIEKLHKKLIKKNITLSAAESCTGGLISHTLTKYSGISKISSFKVDNYPCKIAGSIDDSKINEEIVSHRDQRKIDRFQYKCHERKRKRNLERIQLMKLLPHLFFLQGY